MKLLFIRKLLPVAVLAGCTFAGQCIAETRVVTLDSLEAAVTLGSPLEAGDNLRLNTLVTSETGPLTQQITFALDAGIDSFVGEAAWEISTAQGTGPRLVGVNIDLLDAGNNVLFSDSFQGVLAGFALSTIGGNLGPGFYTLVATGTALRDASLDVTLSFIGSAVPEAQTYGLMLAGLAALGWLGVRRRGT